MSGREAFLTKALSQRGHCVRSDGTTKYGTWFGQQVHSSAYADGDFCAMGLLWCADQTGQLDVLGGVDKAWAWVPSWWQHWKKTGRSTHTPARGRIVFFDFNRTGDPEHVGAVLNADGSTLTTIEFNTLGGQCAVRTRRRSDALGYGDPSWPNTPAPTPTPVPVARGGDSCWMG
jgi:CHAP domain